jgi:hypothetical protein
LLDPLAMQGKGGVVLKRIARELNPQREAAGVLGVSEDLMCIFLGPRGSKAARDAWEEGRMQGRASLRRKQFELAMRGHVVALIWAGKNYLGQSDKLERTETATIDARVTSVALELPTLERIADRGSALKAFEQFRLR